MLPLIIMMIEDEDDQTFFIRFYNQYRRLMYLEAGKFSIHGIDPEDIVQESLAKIIRKIRTFRPLTESKQVSYLISTIYHTGCEFFGKAKRGNSYSLDDENLCLTGVEDDGALPEEQLLRAMEIEEFQKLWAEVSVETRVLLERKYLLKEADAVIAADLNIKASSLRMRLTRAKREVRRLAEQSTVFRD